MIEISNIQKEINYYECVCIPDNMYGMYYMMYVYNDMIEIVDIL